MSEALITIPVLAFFVLAVIWRVRAGRRLRKAQRDDMIRAAEARPVESDEAANRALGNSAWIRMSGT